MSQCFASKFSNREWPDLTPKIPSKTDECDGKICPPHNSSHLLGVEAVALKVGAGDIILVAVIPLNKLHHRSWHRYGGETGHVTRRASFGIQVTRPTEMLGVATPTTVRRRRPHATDLDPGIVQDRAAKLTDDADSDCAAMIDTSQLNWVTAQSASGISVGIVCRTVMFSRWNVQLSCGRRNCVPMMLMHKMFPTWSTEYLSYHSIF